MPRSHNAKAKRGYSRDQRPDCEQVVFGFVVNRDSFPITHEIFTGNIQDRQTLAPCLIASRSTPASRKGPPWCNRPWYGFDDNIAELKKHKPHYVVASRQPDRDRWLAEFEDPKGLPRCGERAVTAQCRSEEDHDRNQNPQRR
jgi:hypothetical protein